MTTQEILQQSPEFRYMLLDRMKQDCLYYLGAGNHMDKYLWAGNVTEQISTMQAVWDSFPPDQKPEWLTESDISSFKEQMEKKHTKIRLHLFTADRVGLKAPDLERAQFVVVDVSPNAPATLTPRFLLGAAGWNIIHEKFCALCDVVLPANVREGRMEKYASYGLYADHSTTDGRAQAVFAFCPPVQVAQYGDAHCIRQAVQEVLHKGISLSIPGPDNSRTILTVPAHFSTRGLDDICLDAAKQATALNTTLNNERYSSRSESVPDESIPEQE